MRNVGVNEDDVRVSLERYVDAFVRMERLLREKREKPKDLTEQMTFADALALFREWRIDCREDRRREEVRTMMAAPEEANEPKDAQVEQDVQATSKQLELIDRLSKRLGKDAEEIIATFYKNRKEKDVPTRKEASELITKLLDVSEKKKNQK